MVEMASSDKRISLHLQNSRNNYCRKKSFIVQKNLFQNFDQKGGGRVKGGFLEQFKSAKRPWQEKTTEQTG